MMAYIKPKQVAWLSCIVLLDMIVFCEFNIWLIFTTGINHLKSGFTTMLEGPGIEYRWGRKFPQSSRPVLGLTQPPVQWVPSLFPGGKVTGA
jgi:hypothetical protein